MVRLSISFIIIVEKKSVCFKRKNGNWPFHAAPSPHPSGLLNIYLLYRQIRLSMGQKCGIAKKEVSQVSVVYGESWTRWEGEVYGPGQVGWWRCPREGLVGGRICKLPWMVHRTSQVIKRYNSCMDACISSPCWQQPVIKRYNCWTMFNVRWNR